MQKAISKLAGLLAVVLLLSALSVTALAAETTLNFTAPSDVEFQLYSAAANFSSKSGNTAVTATSTVTEDGITTYSYEGLAAGNYYYTASGEGYYTVKKNVYYSKAEAAVGGTIDANPGKLAGGGFEPALVNDHTDELNASANQLSSEAWTGYEHIFDTPYFARADYAQRMATGNGKHQQTTQEEMMAFLDKVDDENDDVYTYILGQSPVYNYDIPILIFTKTDLSGAETLEEAAELVRGNGNLTVHISAEVHADEVASGEMALAMIDELDKEYGQELMETINIYVIPRINPDGAHDYVRTNVSQGIDMNRDYMYSQSEEVTMLHYAKQLFMAEVAVDEHEFNVHDHDQRANGTQSLIDLSIGQSGSQNNESITNDLVNEVIGEVFDAGFEAGIRPYYYGPYTTAQYNRGRGYYSLNGTVGILFESRGINYGLHMIERRIYSLYVGTERVLEWAVENHERIKAEVAQARANIISKGATYDTDDLLVLEHSEVPVSKAYSSPLYNMATGELVDENVTTGNRAMLEAKTTRIRPTAYVIPDGNRWTKEALTVLDKHGIKYYRVPNGASIALQQYKGDEFGAELLAETTVYFPDGAYVLPMNQVEGTVLALLMEPDILDVNGSDGPDCSLVQCGVISPTADGTLPIYRYIHDLEDGKISVDINDRDNHGAGWIPISSACEITQSGNYYLTADIAECITVGSARYGIAISADDVTLCLHGYSITTAELDGALCSAGSNVILCNCTGDGGKINNTALRSVLVASGSLTMGDNVHIDDAVISSTSGSQMLSAVQVDDGASFTMEGGTIRNNTLTNTGSSGAGVIVALGTAEVNLTGGRIYDNAVIGSTGIAAVVKLGSGKLTISEGVLIESNTMESSTNGAAIYVDTSGAAVTMTGGFVSGNKGTFGRGVLISEGRFTMSGGMISSNSTTKKPGAGVYINGGTFILSGNGIISRNNANGGAGAGVDLTSGTFTMSGGSITKNTTSSSYGGGLCARNGTATITGGTIAGNLLTNAGRVYGLDVSCGVNGTAGATLTISGGTIGADTTSRNLTVCSGTTILKEDAVVNGAVGVVGTAGRAATLQLQDDARINGSVINSLDPPATNNKGTTTVEISGGSVVGKIYVDTTDGTRENDVTTISGGKFSQMPEAAFLADKMEVIDLQPAEESLIYTVAKKKTTCDASHLGTKLNGTETVLGTEGTTAVYYLETDTTFAPTATIKVSGNVTLCLNDHAMTVTSAAITNFLQVNTGASLTICGGENGTGKIVGSGITDTRCIYVYGTLTMDSGIITGFKTAKNGAGVKCERSGKFIMNGGTIAGNYATTDGGGVLINNNTRFADGVYGFVMNGGTIGGTTLATSTTLNENTGNYAKGSNGGGGVCALGNSKLQLNGGTISYNQSAKPGGGIWGGGTAQVELNGVVITGNKATNGGGVRLGATYPHTMTAGAISNNTATTEGGGVWLSSSGTFTMSGSAVISENTAKLGGGVNVGESAAFNMTGGTISGNSATSTTGGEGGGGLNVAGTLTMSGSAVVSGNTAAHSGGGVNVIGAFIMSGSAAVSGNTAKNSGGGVNVASGAIFHLQGGAIRENQHTTTSNGGAGILNQGTVIMTDGTISDNTATNNGGGVYQYKEGSSFTMSGGTITGNTATASYGGGVLIRKGSFTLSGGTIIGNKIANNKQYGTQVCVGVNSANSSTTETFFTMTDGVVDAAGVSSRDLTVLQGTAAIQGGSVTGAVDVVGAYGREAIFDIEGGSVYGAVTSGTAALPTGTSRGACTTTITGGKFSVDITRDALAAFLPEKSDTMTTVYSVMDYDGDVSGKLVYQVGEGLYSEAEDKFMDFGSSLDLGVVLNAHRNFNVADFASGYTVSASSADRIYEASFDTTTVPGSLLLMAHGIAAKEMHDAITFTVKKGDAVWFEKTLSVYDVAKLWYGDTDTSDQTMLADMIAYGNAARKEFKYNYAEGDVLPALDGDSSTVAEEWTTTEGAGVSNGQQNKVAVTLSLKDQIELNIYINDKAAQISDVKFDGADYAADNYTVDTTSGKYTRVSFFNIPVVDVKKAVEFTVTLSEGTQFTMKYSVADYAVVAKNGEQGALIQELMEYVDSVVDYLK